MNLDWVVVDGKDHTIKCLRCGQFKPLPVPMAAIAFVKWMEVWSKPHEACQKLKGFPRGIGWWWATASTWTEKEFDTWLAKQGRETLVQMLQETDPNGCWADELARLEIGMPTTLETAREQFKIFWRESS